MSHEIETFAFSGKPAWHNLGKKVRSDMTAQEMLEAAELDWEVNLHPSYITIGNEQIATGQSALVRSTDNRILANVSGNWNPMQNSEAFEFFKEYVDAGSMTMECAGSLKNGQIVFGLAKIDEALEVIKGDPMYQYLLFTNPHMYGRSIDVRLTAIRTVCWNTMQMALGSSTTFVDNDRELDSRKNKTSVKTSHRTVFDADKVKETLGLATSKFKAYGDTLKFLTEKRADPTQVEFYLKEVFPHYSGKDKLSRVAEKVKANIETQAGAQFGEGSWYSIFQAVTFTTDNQLGRSEDTRVRSAWYGINADRKQEALKMAVEYAEKA